MFRWDRLSLAREESRMIGALKSLVLAIAFWGCATGLNLRAHTYSAEQVNTRQEARLIEIISVMPAKVVVDNSEQKQNAQIAGTTLGALAGGLAGGLGGLTSGGTAGTTAAGGIVGVAAGSMAPNSVAVDGVTIGYRDGQANKIFTSSQVGMECEFVKGTALLVSTVKGETRIQPNAEKGSCKGVK